LETDRLHRRADVRRDVLRLTLLRIGGALEADGDGRRTGVLQRRTGRGSLLRDSVDRVPVDAADDLPGETGVLERALREHERLARDIGNHDGCDRDGSGCALRYG